MPENTPESIKNSEETICELAAPWVWQAIPRRAPESHKGSYGHVLVVAGSHCYRGAAALACEGALRSGAGLVTLAGVEPVVSAVAARLPSACFLPCAMAEDGTIRAQAAEDILQKAQKCTVLLLGPGLGNTPNTRALVRRLLRESRIPVVLDADGLNAVAALRAEETRPADVWNTATPHILTPHFGEMARLTGQSIAQLQADSAHAARAFAAAQNCVLVLKDHRTLIAAPDGRLWRNTTGNAGLARGGSGDALAGMIAGLLACGLPAEQAAACAVWLHGAAADEAARIHGEYGMLPTDLFDALGTLFAQNGR
jgi:NAD(P)H-hydrate epimerase